MTGPLGGDSAHDDTVGAVSQVVGALIDVLRRFHENDRADWLAARRDVLDSTTLTDEAAAQALAELHGVIHGMGGLVDLLLEGRSRDETESANAELDRLTEQLYELTRI